MPIKINGSTSGSTTITAPATGTDETIELSTALAAKAPLASPALTGTPTVGGTAITALAGLQLVTPTSVAGTGVTLSGGQVAFSGSSTVSVNGCFSSAYSNYRIMLEATSSVGSWIALNWRNAGSNFSTANYYWSYSGWSTNAVAATAQGSTNTSIPNFLYSAASTTAFLTGEIWLPFGSGATSVTWQYIQTGTVTANIMGSGFFSTAQSMDGFTLTAASGTLTGNVRIYGYRNS